MRWLVAHQGWYFFPLLMLEGLSLHWEGIRRVTSRGKVERRWVESAFLLVRLGGLVALVFWFLPPGKAVAVLGRPAGPVRSLHGVLVRPEPHRDAAGLTQAEARLPAPPGADEPQHHRRATGARSSWAD